MLHAESLELRRLKFDLTLIYRIVHGLSALDFFFSFFTLCNSSTRWHQMKLMKQFSRVNSRALLARL